jgi:hypothetical protein
MKLTLNLTIGLMALTLAAHAQAHEGTAIAKAVKGNATYIDALGGTHVLTVGTVLKEGYTVKTGAGGSVDLVLEKNGRYVGLFEDTTLSINRLSYQTSLLGDVFDTQLDLKQGRMIASVSKLLAGARYEVKTPQGVANVKGTEFYYDGKTGQIWVVSGLVHFEMTLLQTTDPLPPPPGTFSASQSIDVPAGFTLFIPREIDMVSFRNGGLQPVFRGGAPVPQDVIDRINNTPVLGGHYNNPGNSEVTVYAAWFTKPNAKQNVVELIGIPALVVPSP